MSEFFPWHKSMSWMFRLSLSKFLFWILASSIFLHNIPPDWFPLSPQDRHCSFLIDSSKMDYLYFSENRIPLSSFQRIWLIYLHALLKYSLRQPNYYSRQSSFHNNLSCKQLDKNCKIILSVLEFIHHTIDTSHVRVWFIM